MRLLEYTSNGSIQLTEPFISEKKRPPYAILSHTWQDGQEVTFDDLMNGNGTDKTGYNKIMFCARQAHRDGLNYCWVDTCCINKSSSAELSESINSMFRWYRKARKCYVYLPDVSKNASDGNNETHQTWESTFRRSRWFTRGWTLQELIAPKTVEFFSREEELLGSKETLAQLLQGITHIPIKILQGGSFLEYSMTERFSWAAKRQTTRAEDESYCLLGIFDIQMPLLYGEGRQKAIKRLKREIKEAAEYHTDTQFQQVQSGSQREDRKINMISKWLSAPDPTTNYQKALKQRQDDTGTWFLKTDQYTQWKTGKLSFLWLHGIPGCGKTILTSTILQDIFQYCNADSSKVIAYFFFDFNDVKKQSVELMLRSLVDQLLQQCVVVPKSLWDLFTSHENGNREYSLDVFLEVLQQFLQEFPRVYIILDALDECSQRAQLTNVLETMSTWHVQSSHILLVSRRERDIETSLETFIQQHSFVDLQSELVDRDIEKYVRERLSNDKQLSRWGKDPALRHDIETTLMKGARGMFRWAVCQLDALRECRTRASLRKSLEALPPTLDQTYDRILASISTTDIRYAIPILRWLTFSKRPLSVDEIAELVAIDLGDEAKFDRDEVLEDPWDVLNICPSLVIITSEEKKRSSTQAKQIVALAHYSVKEYLVSDRIRQGLAACYSMQSALCHDAIARSCIAYLLQFQGSHVFTKDNEKEFSLAKYAAEFWTSHASATEEQAETYIREAVLLLSEGSDAYSNLVGFQDPDGFLGAIYSRGQRRSRATPLYWVALSGLTKLARLLLDQGVKTNAQNCGVYGNALQAASGKGHYLTARLLLERGADVNAQGGIHCNALHAASLNGRCQIVKLLLDHGADINAQGSSTAQYGNALEAASAGGHQSIVELLLDNGADINIHSDRTFGTALQQALKQRHQSIVELLQRRGADFDVQSDERYGNTLQAASFGGNEVVVKQLIEKGVSVDAHAGRLYGNALQVASYRGYETIVKLLLDEGADINAPGKTYGNALQEASYQGHEEIVKLLLDNGADVDAPGSQKYGTALQVAAHEGRAKVVKLLLNEGANINFQSGGYYGNALQAASYGGHRIVVELLLNEGADANPLAGDVYRRTALHFAAYGGNTRENSNAFQSLIDFGLDRSALDVKGDGVLTYAIYSGRLKMVQAVLSSGPTLTSEDTLWSPLHWACRLGKADIIELLTEEGIRGECVTTPEGQWSPLDIAIFHRNAGILENLSTACKSVLGPETDPGRLPGLTLNRYECDGCFLRIYGTRFHCYTCPDLDYCFMCRLSLHKLHEDHDWKDIRIKRKS